MAPQISLPSALRADSLRRSKNDLMLHWRRRSLVSQVPGLLTALVVVVVLLDSTALASAAILLFPAHWQPSFLRQLLEAFPQGSPSSNDFWLPGAGLASVLAAVAALGGVVFSHWIIRASGLVLGWLMLLTSLVLTGIDLCHHAELIGPSPLASLNEWFVWLACWTALLTLGLEMVSRRCWVLLVGAAVTGLLVSLARHWPVAATVSPHAGVYTTRLGMMIPALVQVGSYAAFALAWALALLHLGAGLARPGQPEPALTLANTMDQTLRLGLMLIAVAMLLDSSWGSQETLSLWGLQPSQLWALSPLVLALVLLVACGRLQLSDQTLAVAVVVSYTALGMSWLLSHAPVVPGLWLTWLGLVSLCLAVHALLVQYPAAKGS